MIARIIAVRWRISKSRLLLISSLQQRITSSNTNLAYAVDSSLTTKRDSAESVATVSLIINMISA